MPEKPTYEELFRKVQEYEEILQDPNRGKETWEELRSSEKKYRRMVESLERDYIIYSHDTQGVFTYLSPSVTNVLGYTRDEFMGHYAVYMTDSVINKDVQQHTLAALQGNTQEPYEAEFRHKNGNRLHMRITEVPVFDDNGKVFGIEGIVQDVTALKKAEAERDALIKDLKKALSEVKTLSGLLPICMGCKKIRDDNDQWHHIENYVAERSDADFSHGYCPECYRKEMEQIEHRNPDSL